MAEDGRVTIRAILDSSKADAEAAKLKKTLVTVGDGAFDGVGEGADKAAAKTGKLTDKAVEFGKRMESVGAAATVNLSLPLVAVGKSAVSTAAQFNDAMSQVEGALGDAGADMGGLSELALQLGADTIFSATEAGSAMVELAKGGLTEAQIKAGALKAAMDLAAAGSLNLADAANSTVQMMGAFNLAAEDSGAIANALAGSANASSADVDDLTQAMSQCSAQANLVGWSIQETAAVLGLFSDAGVKGSDAGTSLKTMIQSLAAPVDKAADCMDDLGLKVRDSEGNMRSVSEIAEELKTKLGGLSAAQRDAALQTIFGSDASRVAAILLQSGSEGLRKYIDATNDSTAAEKMAEAQKSDLSWAMENMEGSIESASIALGNALAPMIVEVAGIIGDLAEGFSDLDSGTQLFIASALGFVATVGPIIGVVAKLVKGSELASSVMTTTAKVLGIVTASSKASAGGMTALAASEGAVATGATFASTALRVLKGALAATGIGVAVVLVGELVGQFMEFQAKANLAKEATDGLRDAVAASEADYSAAAQGAAGLSSAQGGAAESAKECLQAQADLAGKIKTTAEETGANAALVETYVGAIDELTSKYDENGNRASLNASEQARLEASVAGLNEVCGTTYSVVDAANGVLSVSSDELHKNADAWIRNAEAQAAQEAYTGLVKQQMENERELAKVTDEMAAAQEEYGIKVGDTTVMLGSAYDGYRDLEGKQKDLTAAMDENADAQEFYLGKLEETGPVLDEVSEATSGAVEETVELSKEVTELAEGLSVFASSNSAFSSMLEASGMSVEDLAVKMDTAGISVDDLKKGIEDYSSSAQNAFGQIEQKSDITLDQMLVNLQENARVTQEWGDNLKTLYADAGEGSKRAFIDYIAGLGPEYAPIVADLVNASSETMDALVAAYESGGIAGANAYLAGISTLPGDAAAATAPTGPAVDQSVADGINDNLDVVYDACGNLTTAGTINPGDVDSSPGGMSNVESYASGQDAASGTAAASSDAVSKLSADHMSSASGDAWFAGYNMTAQSYAQGIGGGQGSAVSAAMTVSKQVADHFSSSSGDAWWAGYNMTIGMAEGISAGRSAAVNAAAAVSAAAVAASRAELDERSPSKVMREVGRYFTEGLAVGIGENDAMAVKAAKMVASGAVGEVVDCVSGMAFAAPPVSAASVPAQAIDWYATGGTFDTAAMIGVGGEIPSVHYASANYGPAPRSDGSIPGAAGAGAMLTKDDIAEAVGEALEAIGLYVRIDGRAIVGELIADIDKGLGYLEATRSR